MNCTDPRLYALLPAMHNTTQNPTNPAYKKTSKRFWKKKVPKCLPPFNNIFYGGWWWSSFLVIVMLYKRSSLSFFSFSVCIFFCVCAFSMAVGESEFGCCTRKRETFVREAVLVRWVKVESCEFRSLVYSSQSHNHNQLSRCSPVQQAALDVFQ